jgi:hypothetical protein
MIKRFDINNCEHENMSSKYRYKFGVTCFEHEIAGYMWKLV